MPSSEKSAARSTVSVRRRLQIIHAAFGIGAKKGLAAMTMDEVAYAAKLSKGLPFYYFRSKQNLYLAMIEQFASDIVDRAAKILGAEQSCEAALRALAWEHVAALTVACEYPQITIEFWAMATRDCEIAERLRRIHHRMTACFTDLLERGTAAREFTCSDCEAVARAIYTTCAGIVSQWVLGERAVDPRGLLEATLDGLLAAPVARGAEGGSERCPT